MIYIKHRQNTLAELNHIHLDWGVEIDLRSNVHTGEIHLSHDPWKVGVSFERWLKAFVSRRIRGPLVLNTKEDGLEDSILRMIKKYRVTNYFFLDTAFPTLVKRILKHHERHFYFRYSKFEKISGTSKLKTGFDWIWLDCFNGEPLPANEVKALGQKYRICMVSPELHQKSNRNKFRALIPFVDAICTKDPQAWEAIL